MVIPVGVIQLHESHAALYQSASQQAIVCIGGLTRLGAVKIQSLFGFPGQIDQFGSARLHPEAHLVRGDPGCYLLVARAFETGLI